MVAQARKKTPASQGQIPALGAVVAMGCNGELVVVSVLLGGCSAGLGILAGWLPNIVCGVLAAAVTCRVCAGSEAVFSRFS